MGIRRLRLHRLAREEGSALIEVLAAAVLLAVISMATLAVLDAAGNTSGRSKARSIAATLAEEDQERMRAMRAVDLAALQPATKTVNVDGGGAYTVDSRSEWVRDAGGVESCADTNNQKQGDYLRITSTVSSPLLRQPVRSASLVAPPVEAFGNNLGTLRLIVKDRDNDPVAGVTVTISGTGLPTFTDTTNSLGCAVFSRIPAGTYAATMAKADHVDPALKSPGVPSGTVVTAGTVTVASARFDVAATATATFQTWVAQYYFDAQAGGGTAGWAASKAKSLRVVARNADEAARAVTATSWQAGLVAPGLYPFPEGYDAYGGSCKDADPGDAHFTTYPDSQAATAPGATPDVVVRQPPLAVRVVTSANAAQAGARVVATHTLCSADTFKDLTTDANGFVSKSATVFDPGLPYGTYTVCAEVAVPNRTSRWLIRSATVANTSFAPTAPTTLTLPSGTGSSTRCPT